MANVTQPAGAPTIRMTPRGVLRLGHTLSEGNAAGSGRRPPQNTISNCVSFFSIITCVLISGNVARLGNTVCPVDKPLAIPLNAPFGPVGMSLILSHPNPFLRIALSLMLWLSAAFSAGATREAGPVPDLAQPVTVYLASGRKLSARVDPRSDTAQLILRSGNDSVSITRPVDWDRVIRVETAVRTLSGEELRQLIAWGPRLEEVPAPAAMRRRNSAFSQAPGSKVGTANAR